MMKQSEIWSLPINISRFYNMNHDYESLFRNFKIHFTFYFSFFQNLYLNIKPCSTLQSRKMRPDAKTWRPSLPHLTFCHFLFLVLISQSAVRYLPGIDLVTQLIYQKTDALQEPRSFAACHTLWCPCLRFLTLLVLKSSDEESKLRQRWS